MNTRIKRKFRIEVEQNPEAHMKRFSVYLTYRDSAGVSVEKEFHGGVIRPLMVKVGLTVEDAVGLGIEIRKADVL